MSKMLSLPLSLPLNRRTVLLALSSSALLVLPGCDQNPIAPAAAARPAVSLEDGDECHVCGMMITRFPGPKGQAYVDGADQPLKFCSTRDLFAFATQPEAQSVLREVYVHDMGKTSWDAPDDSAFVDGRTAHYAICHPLQGAMGATLASYAQLQAAQAFAAQHQGQVVAFDAVDSELLNTLHAAACGSRGLS